MDEENKLEEATQPLEEDYKAKYFRQLAEMENMRKRMTREKQELIRFGVENAIADFLPIIDQFENALRFAASGSKEVQAWAGGFQMFLSQFKEALSNQGIVSYESLNHLFDPTLHEAVEVKETADVADGTILQEFTKGYKSAARVIRPARVQVAKVTNNLDAEFAAQETVTTPEGNL